MYELHLAGSWLDDERNGIRPIQRPASAQNSHQRFAHAPDGGTESSRIPVPPGQSSRVERRRAPRIHVSLQDAALATLDKLHRGVVLLGVDGSVQFVNRAARAMLHRGNGPVLRQHRLTFSQLPAAAAFDDWLASRRGSLALRVAGTGRRWHEAYRVLASSMSAERSNGGYCVFIYEPNSRRPPLPVQVLRKLYGLTAAEARLVNQLFAGRSLRAAAEAIYISLNTAKTQLKRIFVKCEVGSQAELLQFLSLGPRAL